MTEKLFQYLWQFQYFNRSALFTSEGEELQVLSPGRFNRDQGPDFLDAKLKVGATVLAGSVELHLKTAEWFHHGHQHDPNYRNVILHVVFEHDGTSIPGLPLLELQPHIPQIMLERYNGLMNSAGFIACGRAIETVREISWLAWKERLLAERLTRKAGAILERLQQSCFHWEEVFWWLLARNFGGPVNGEAFEQVARTLSINLLARHKHSIQQLEALLLGQAGLLEPHFEDPYAGLLYREYAFLQKKYGLPSVPIAVHFLRMRPGNFPSIRLAQLAMLVYQSRHLFSRVLEERELSTVKRWLKVTANDFWHYHYTLKESSAYRPKTLGDGTIDSLLINTIAPVLFAYGLHHQDERLKNKAIEWLAALPAEDNAVIRGFHKLGTSCQTARDSQALLELKSEYCHKKRCLECSVGHHLLRSD